MPYILVGTADPFPRGDKYIGHPDHLLDIAYQINI